MCASLPFALTCMDCWKWTTQTRLDLYAGQVRRPNNYDINVAVMLGPTDPDPTMDVSNLDIVKTVVQDSPHKLFIGGLPCDWTEDQVWTLHGSTQCFFSGAFLAGDGSMSVLAFFH